MSIDGGKEIWDSMWAGDEEINENSYFKCVVEAIAENVNGSLEGLKIIEAGSGTGTSSFQLTKMGARVTLVDYSEGAISKSKRMFERNNIEASFICSDIRNMPIDDNTYDIVFNSGVMEHFDYNEQVKILTEMERICKPHGKVITMTPNAKCLLYRVWKWILETHNAWSYGEENPVITMANQYHEANLNLEKEYSIGFENALQQFGVFNEFQVAAKIFGAFYETAATKEKEIFEGYLLCSVGVKS